MKNLKTSWGQLLLLLIPIILTIPPLLDFISEHVILIIITIIIFIISWIHTVNNSVDFHALRVEANNLSENNEHLINNLESVPVKVVKSVFNHLNFKYSERITIYRFDENCFVPVGRYSINPEFKNYGRKSYPKDQGFIGYTWKNGAVHFDGLPDPVKSKKRYIKDIIAKCNMEEDIIEALSMKSRAYYCRNLLYNHEPIAVIVFESIEDNLPVSTKDIDLLLEGVFGQLLVSVIRINLPLGRE